MEKNFVNTATFKALCWISFVAVLALVLGSFTWMVPADVEAPTAAGIAALINVPVVNQTSVLDAVADVQSTLDEDDAWENEAIDLAEDEYSRSDYKYIARKLSDIDDRDDIDRVVIKDVEVNSKDADDKDALIVHTLKVYYEDTSGEDKKVYLIVETEIEEGEVEDQDINEA